MGDGEAEVQEEEVEEVEEEEEAAIKIMTKGSQVINMKIIPIPLALTQVQTMDVLTKLTATQASCITTPISKNKIWDKFKAKLTFQTQTLFIYYPNLIKMMTQNQFIQ